MKKKFALTLSTICTFALCASLCFALSGCSSNENSNKGSEKNYDTDLSAEDKENTMFVDNAEVTEELNVVIADDEVCTITITAKVIDKTWEGAGWVNVGYRMFVTNNSDKHLYGHPFWGFTVNGTTTNPYGGFFLGAGKSTQTDIYFDEEDVVGIEGLKDVHGKIEVRDADEDAYVTLGEYILDM